jgi:competence protein ComEA
MDRPQLDRPSLDWGTIGETLTTQGGQPSPSSTSRDQVGAGASLAHPAHRVAWVLLCGLAAAVFLGAAALLALSSPTPELTLPSEGATGPASSGLGPGLLTIDVEGAVQRPGLYRLPRGSRVADAIAAAGGFGSTVDAAAAQDALNLADPLQDGTKVLVPGRGAGPGPPGGATAATGRPAKVDLNHATATELDTLPGIGPATAAKIIASRQGRPFTRIDELRSRKLIGAATFEKVKDLVRVG